MTNPRSFLTLAALAACLALPACDSGKSDPAPAPTPAPTANPNMKMYTPLSDAQMDQARKALTEARKYGDEADKFLNEGRDLERSDGRQAANASYRKAGKLYIKAQQTIEPWVEPDFGQVTEAQVRNQMGQWERFIGDWQKSKSSYGRVPPE